MNKMSLVGLLAVAGLVIACFYPWVIIPTNNCIISGVDAGCSNYGKPGYLHFIFATIFVVFLFLPRLFAKRMNLLVASLNLAWAIKNFLVIGNRCEGGDCPEKQWAIYALLVSALVMMLVVLFPKMPKPKAS